MIVEDLTTGPIAGHFRRLALPAAIGMLFSTLYNIVDTFYAGLISTTAQAGLAIGFQAFFVLVSVGFGMGSAMSALVGHSRGRKDLVHARLLTAQGLGLAVFLTVILMVFAHYTGPPLMALVSEPGAYREAGLSFFRVLLWSLPGFILAYGGNGVLQARGDTVSMQRALVAAFLANILLNPILMYGIPGILPGLGLTGIALSTVICQTSVAAFVIYRIFGRAMMQGLQRQDFVPIPKDYATIAGQAIPASFALLVNFASGFVVQFALKGFGESALAAFAISLRFEQIFLLPAVGITIALVPIAAQNFGAGHHDRLRQSFRICCAIGVCVTALAFPLLWFFGGAAASLFTRDPDVIRITALFLKVEAVILPIYVILFSVNSLLQALKAAVWTMWIGIYRQGIGIALFIWVFTSVFDFGLLGVRLGIAAAVITGLALSLAIMRHVVSNTLGNPGKSQP